MLGSPITPKKYWPNLNSFFSTIWTRARWGWFKEICTLETCIPVSKITPFSTRQPTQCALTALSINFIKTMKKYGGNFSHWWHKPKPWGVQGGGMEWDHSNQRLGFRAAFVEGFRNRVRDAREFGGEVGWGSQACTMPHIFVLSCT